MAFKLVENEQKIDIVLVRKEHQNVMAIPCECKHILVVSYVDEKR